MTLKIIQYVIKVFISSQKFISRPLALVFRKNINKYVLWIFPKFYLVENSLDKSSMWFIIFTAFEFIAIIYFGYLLKYIWVPLCI